MVEVVVLELQIVRFGGHGVGGRVLAETVRVDEVVTGVRGVFPGEALDEAVFDLDGGYGVGEEGEGEKGEEGDGDDGGDDGRHCELCWMD